MPAKMLLAQIQRNYLGSGVKKNSICPGDTEIIKSDNYVEIFYCYYLKIGI